MSNRGHAWDPNAWRDQQRAACTCAEGKREAKAPEAKAPEAKVAESPAACEAPRVAPRALPYSFQPVKASQKSDPPVGVPTVYKTACPHCGEHVEIEQINCGIFRHGNTLDGQPLSPHLPRAECDRLRSERLLIHGCGRPFKFDGKTISVCEYE